MSGEEGCDDAQSLIHKGHRKQGPRELQRGKLDQTFYLVKGPIVSRDIV